MRNASDDIFTTMKIKNVRIEKTDDHISLLADCKIRTIGWDTVYFTFGKQYADYLYEDASPFAAALLIPSMRLGQNLIIDGSVSERLMEGMKFIMEKMVAWPFGLKPITIQAKHVTKDNAQPEKVASFFSGGVDSFYTYLKHRSDKKDKISHFILVRGADIDPRNKKLWDETKENVQKVADEDGIEMVAAESNVQTLIEPIIAMDYTHGGCLAAIGLCLRKGFKKIYIASTFGYAELMPYGSHPELDGHWSSEAIMFEHDGAEADRFEKIERQIAKSPIALKHLRVCYMNKNGAYNCGNCEKCYRTMVSLYIVGKLNESETFPNSINPDHLTFLISQVGFALKGHEQNLAALKSRNLDPRLQQAIEKGLAHGTNPANSIKERALQKIIYLDHMYFRERAHKIWAKLVRPY